MRKRNSIALAGAVAFVAIAYGDTSAQTHLDVHATVVDSNDKPIADVSVSSDQDPRYGSGRVWLTKTGIDGGFTLEKTGEMIRFLKSGYEPLAVAAGGKPVPLKFVLQAAKDDFVLQRCAETLSGQQTFGPPELRFSSDRKTFQKARGNSDIDYTQFTLRPKGSKVGLELWFGAMALDFMPSDDALMKSEKYSMRNVTRPDGALVGVDATGVIAGKRWRNFSVVMQGARYSDATDEQAKLFDAVIESACGARPEQK